MSAKGSLILDFFDVYGDRPDERADVLLTHTRLSNAVQVRNAAAGKALRIQNLECAAGGCYRLLVYPMRHLPVSQFVQVREGKSTRYSIVLPVDPKRVQKAQFPEFDACPDDFRQVLSKSVVEGMESASGPEIYNGVDDVRKAGLLNLYTRMKATLFPGGRDVFSFVTSLTRIRGDRVFAVVQKELRDEVKNSVPAGLFREVSGKLHTPPPGYVLADSFKTLERYGNLQITFFCKPETLEFLADIDIDDAQGIEHVFQVVGNAISGEETHPYNIHQILLGYQKLDPDYRLYV